MKKFIFILFLFFCGFLGLQEKAAAHKVINHNHYYGNSYFHNHYRHYCNHPHYYYNYPFIYYWYWHPYYGYYWMRIY